MKRRKFIRNIGLGSSLGLVGTKELLANDVQKQQPYKYPKPNDFTDCLSDEGYLAIRLDLKGEYEALKKALGSLKVKSAELVKQRDYSFTVGEIGDKESSINSDAYWRTTTVLWLKDFSTKSSLSFRSKKREQVALSTLIEQPEFVSKSDVLELTANILQYSEIGTFKANDFLVEPIDHKDFSFAIMADPQGGDPDCACNKAPTRVKVHNAFVEESIRIINELETKPAFTLILGDIVDSQGEEKNFLAMEEFYKKINTPILLEIGNHETRYNSTFTPGYNMDAFSNYFDSQKRINGQDKMLYSFDIGNYHFIVWPDPLRREFWENHPHYIEWLQRDLEKNKEKPTIFFQHVPIHPIGIDPLLNYAESPYIKKLLLEMLAKWGNVKYVFSGHVHIPIKASAKTARTYKGINLVNLPAAGFRPRAFGEEDFFGGPSQGVAIVSVKNEKVSLSFKEVTHNLYDYDERFEELDLKKDILCYQNKWELPRNEKILNGEFKNLDQWHRPYVYMEDERPSNSCETRTIDGTNTLYLKARKRAHDIPGQDRLPQTLNKACQAISIQDGKIPGLNFRMKISKKERERKALNGAYVWCEGYEGPNKLFNLFYFAGVATGSLLSRFETNRNYKDLYLDLPYQNEEWHDVNLNLNSELKDLDIPANRADRLIVNLGVWNVNDGNNSGVEFFVQSLKDFTPDDLPPSTCGNNPVLPKEKDEIYYARVVHIAGEHTLGKQEQLYL
ncbi:MAG: metallophosphoesterase [Cyclobacteriaceae bacterium]